MAATEFLLAQQLRSQNKHGYCHPVDNTQPKFVLHGGDPGRMRGKEDMTIDTEKAGRAHDVGVETQAPASTQTAGAWRCCRHALNWSGSENHGGKKRF